VPSADRLLRLLSASILALCLLAFVRVSLLAGAQLPLNFNEGWNAYHAADLAAGRPLYPDPSQQFFTNYPPLSFLLIAPAGRVLGDPMLAGRVIALAAFAAWVLLIMIAARRLGCSRSASMFGGAVLATFMFVFSDFYVGVNDPEILGHALQLGGLLLLLRERRSGTAIASAALLFTAGVFVKNNLIALPLAGVVWLLIVDRRAGVRLVTAGAIIGAATAAACYAAFGSQFVAQVLAPRGYIPAKAAMMWWQWTRRMILPLAALFLVAWRGRRDPSVQLVTLYAIASIAVGTALSGGEGVYWNAMFDADAAMALTATIAIGWVTPAAAVPVAFLAVPALVIAMSASIHWLSPRFWFDPKWSDKAAVAGDIAFIRGRPGPALCEDLALCYWAGKPVEADIFNVRQRSRYEWWRVETLIRRVQAREFSTAQFEENGRSLGPQFEEAVRANYRIDHSSEFGGFWVPR
jgi:hypothetical protein